MNDLRVAAERLIVEERQRIADLVDAYWAFDHQEPAASWHEKQACLEAIKSGEVPFEQLKQLKTRKAISASKTKMLDGILAFVDFAIFGDDLPIDEEFLRSVGFEDCLNNWFLQSPESPYGAVVAVKIKSEDGSQGVVVVGGNSNRHHPEGCGPVGKDWTRRQLLDLLKALGIATT